MIPTPAVRSSVASCIGWWQRCLYDGLVQLGVSPLHPRGLECWASGIWRRGRTVNENRNRRREFRSNHDGLARRKHRHELRGAAIQVSTRSFNRLAVLIVREAMDYQRA